jgi:hypothetical protein
MDDVFPCSCGHQKSRHEHRDRPLTPKLNDICWECLRLDYSVMASMDFTPYHMFTPDNLRYLENKSEDEDAGR